MLFPVPRVAHNVNNTDEVLAQTIAADSGWLQDASGALHSAGGQRLANSYSEAAEAMRELGWFVPGDALASGVFWRAVPGDYSNREAKLQAALRRQHAAKMRPSKTDSTSGSTAASSSAVDVLLLTATETETAALATALIDAGWRPRTQYESVNTYHIWGGAGGTVVASVRSGMGTRGAGGSGLTTADAIGDLRPRVIIAVGIAFGVNETKQPIGCVLVSTQLIDYEAVKIGTDSEGAHNVTERGERPNAHPMPLGRFQSASLKDAGFDVQYGQIITGDKLVDNAPFRDALIARFPEAVGGEMEASGIKDAALRSLVPWLIVKAVCDHGANKSEGKKEKQAQAARAAAGAVVHVLKEGAFATRPGS